MDNKFLYGLLFFILLIGLFLLVALIIIQINLSDYQADCVSRGYPRAHLARGVVYCVRQVDGTDEVIMLSELKRRDE